MRERKIIIKNFHNNSMFAKLSKKFRSSDSAYSALQSAHFKEKFFWNTMVRINHWAKVVFFFFIFSKLSRAKLIIRLIKTSTLFWNSFFFRTSQSSLWRKDKRFFIVEQPNKSEQSIEIHMYVKNLINRRYSIHWIPKRQ